jgi:hypothetical protein
MSMKGWTEGDIAAYRKRMMGICAETLDKKPRLTPIPKKERRPKRRGPNKIEAEYNFRFLEMCGMYEAVTFRLSGGSRYTPDWIAFLGSQMIAVEVKGAYRFGSEGRALTAFKECRARFPRVRFMWMQKTDDGEWTEKHAED